MRIKKKLGKKRRTSCGGSSNSLLWSLSPSGAEVSGAKDEVEGGEGGGRVKKSGIHNISEVA